jgi:TonB-linked SusC/RagA family outer membrane protein
MRSQFSTLSYVVAGLMLLLDAPLAAPLGAQVRPRAGAASDAEAITINAPPARSAQQGTSPLERIVTLDLRKVSLRSALDEIGRQSGVALTYSPRVVPVDKVVSVRGEKITVAKALAAVLRGTGVEAEVTAGGGVMLVKGEGKAEREAEAEQAGVGAVTGRVMDAANNRPLGGAVVTIKGTDLRTATNDSGWYGMRVPSGLQTVMVRFLGYGSDEQVVLVPDSQAVRRDFALHMAMSRLQETVTTATGKQRKLELGNDITVINADSIVATQPVASVTDLLEGRVPGMVIQRTSGAPGDPARIRLRGASSPGLSNDPIIIVDGMRVYSDQSGQRGANLASGLYAAPSPLDYIDPNNIETIEVVKGPSAATLYGQDAANGVIVITTKKGQSGPARWKVSAERGMTEMAGSYPELMVRWGHLLTDDARVVCPGSNRYLTATGGPACEADSTVRFQMLNDPDLTVLDQGSRTAATIGVSGGSNALTYNVTGSYRDEIGLVKLPTYEAERFRAERGVDVPGWMDRPQKLERWGAASRLVAQLGSKADVSLSAGISRTEQQRSSLERQLGTLMSVYLDRSSGTYYKANDVTSFLPTEQTLTDYYERATADATELTNGANLNWRPFPWLTATADAGIGIVQRSDEVLLPTGFVEGTYADGRLQTARGSSFTSTVNLRAVVSSVPLGRGFKLQVAAGANYAGNSVEDLTGNVVGLGEGTQAPYAGSSMNVNQQRLENATFGWYVEPQISHKRFWLSTGLRLDGGSTFGTRAKLPAFPKLSFSYLVSDEGFFPFKEFVPLLRLRVAYGQAGRQPGPVDKLRLYQAAAPVMINGATVDGVVLKSIGNTKLEPERSAELEGGFDADLFGDRLTLSFTGFRKTTTDAILSVPLAPSVYGGGSTLKNIGVIRNSGFEASVGARVVRTDPVSFDVQLAVSQQRNEVLKLGQGVEPFYSSGDPYWGGARVVAGYPLFGRWTRPLLGYADGNGNGYLEENEVLVGDTAVFVGGTLPNYTANLNATLSLLRGAVSVTAGFSYEDGMSQNNEVGRQLAPFTAGWNDPNSSLAEQARVLDRTGFSWVQTVSTFRFNTLALTYHAPTSLAQRVGARALSLSLQGTNLGLATNYRGIDPNVNAYSTGNGVTDTGVLPQPRGWQIRVSANY